MNEKYALLYCLGRHKIYFTFQQKFLEHLKNVRSISLNSSLGELEEVLHSFNPTILDEIYFSSQFQELLNIKENYQYVIYGEDLYPNEFYYLTDPPLIFSYLGNPCWQGTEKLTVVGSRNPTEKSLHWMSLELNKIIKTTEWVTVSGGAIGVDQWIHYLSVNAKKKTIAILPSGLGALYPLVMKKLALQIIENGGCLISEFFPLEEVKKYHFKFRNRLIAALNQRCLVVEAKEKSGSLITGHFVIEMGKNLFVLPGHPLDPNFKGSNELIKLGGTLFTCHEDFNNFI